jgi:hypothetical protein
MALLEMGSEVRSSATGTMVPRIVRAVDGTTKAPSSSPPTLQGTAWLTDAMSVSPSPYTYSESRGLRVDRETTIEASETGGSSKNAHAGRLRAGRLNVPRKPTTPAGHGLDGATRQIGDYAPTDRRKAVPVRYTQTRRRPQERQHSRRPNIAHLHACPKEASAESSYAASRLHP